MAPSNKRKRTSVADTTTRNGPPAYKPKRPRKNTKSHAYAEPSSSEEPNSSENEFYEVKRILKERKWRGKLQYLIEWEGTDPAGNKWPDDWKSPADITKDLIDEWKSRSHKNKQKGQNVKDRHRANNRVIEDSPDGPDVKDISTKRQATHVQPSPQAKDLSGYEFHSQLPSSAPITSSPRTSLSQTQTQGQTRGVSQNEYSSITGTQDSNPGGGIVPDSQFEDGSASYVPTTQECTVSGAEESQLHAQPDCINSQEAVIPTSSALLETQPQHSSLVSATSIEQLDPIEDTQQSQPLTTTTQGAPRQLSFAIPEIQNAAKELQEQTIEIPESPAQPEPESIETPEPTFFGSSQQVETDTIEKVLLEEFELAGLRAGEFNCAGTSKRDKREPATPPGFVGSAQTSNAPTPTTISEHSQQQQQQQQEEEEEEQEQEQEQQHEQEAQEIPRDLYIPTQESSIRTTVELHIFEVADLEAVKSSVSRAETPQSRHDSSQESPGRSLSSPVPRPLPLSLHTTESIVPPRPKIPEASTVSTNMADSNEPDPPQVPLSPTGLAFKAEMEEMFRRNREKAEANRPPRKSRLTTSPLVFSSRSPSTIPDRSPRPPEPTSLSTSALINSTAVEMPSAPSLLPPTAVADADADSEVPEIQVDDKDNNDEDKDENLGENPDEDDEDDNVSLLNDDLQLLAEEHIVSLAMRGRQKNMFIYELERDKELIMRFLQSPHDFDEINKLESILQRLRAIETHVDLIWAEADSTSQVTGAMTQASWDSDSCVKFRFLDALLGSLRVRERELNCVIVIEKDDMRLLEMLEKFLQGKSVRYKFPAKGRVSNPSLTEALTVTLLSADSSVVMRPADFIICLDGTLDAAQIRKKKWAINLDRSFVPIFELIIPRSIGHIERYISPALRPKRRLHTLFAALAQVHDCIGRPMVASPNAIDAAELVAEYIVALDEQEGLPEWPLPSIGSIKTIIAFSSQQSEVAMPSPPPPDGVKASKRPLDDGPLDPAKRVRLTPQPPSSIDSNANEVTHISDSMPGTAAATSTLQEQLDSERALRKASERQVREWRAALDQRHNEYEDLKTRHRLALGQIDGANNARDKANERLESKVADLEVVRTELAEQQQVNLASEDDKVSEVARLRQLLTEAKKSEERALRKAESAERTLEYTKEQYRTASDRATELNNLNSTLNSDLASSQKRASKQVLELKRTHLNNAYNQLERKVQDLEIRNRNLEKIITQKDEEIARLNKQRSGYGTRGGSVPRSPQVRGSGSRAASPAIGARDRVAQIRNG